MYVCSVIGRVRTLNFIQQGRENVNQQRSQHNVAQRPEVAKALHGMRKGKRCD
jgi:hypothetical protein